MRPASCNVTKIRLQNGPKIEDICMEFFTTEIPNGKISCSNLYPDSFG